MNTVNTVNTDDAIARLAAFGLPGAPTEPMVLDDPDQVLVGAAARRVLPWVAGAVDAGQVADVNDEWRQELRRRHLDAVQTTMSAHAAAASVIARLRDAGVGEIRVLKGCATAHVDHHRPTDRFSSDVDLLIRPGDLPVALTAFPETAVPAPRRTAWQQRYGKATTVHDPSGVDIDIHTMLGQGYFGLAIPTDDLLADGVDFTIAGTPMVALDGPNRLIHAANHVAASNYKGLHSIRDVLQLVLVSQVDWQAAIDRAERWHVDALFARGVVEAWDTFGVPEHPIVTWARGIVPIGRQRLAFGLVGDRPRGHLLTAPLALRPHRWPGYVGPMLVPSRAYLAENGKTWSTRTRQMLAELTPRRGR